MISCKNLTSLTLSELQISYSVRIISFSISPNLNLIPAQDRDLSPNQDLDLLLNTSPNPFLNPPPNQIDDISMRICKVKEFLHKNLKEQRITAACIYNFPESTL